MKTTRTRKPKYKTRKLRPLKREYKPALWQQRAIAIVNKQFGLKGEL